jgi:hypothetical protein
MRPWGRTWVYKAEAEAGRGAPGGPGRTCTNWTGPVH